MRANDSEEHNLEWGVASSLRHFSRSAKREIFINECWQLVTLSNIAHAFICVASASCNCCLHCSRTYCVIKLPISSEKHFLCSEKIIFNFFMRKCTTFSFVTQYICVCMCVLVCECMGVCVWVCVCSIEIDTQCKP